MTIPSTEPNTPVPSKPGIPRALLLGGAVFAVGGVAAAAFFIMNKQSGDGASGEDSTPPPAPPVVAQKPAGKNPKAAGATAIKKPTQVAKAPVNPAVAAAKAQAAQALGTSSRRDISLETSFDNVPKSLGGTEERYFPAAPIPAPDNGNKIKPIVQGKLPVALRQDPFLSRLAIPILRQYAYTLAVPIRMAPFPKPIPIPPKDLDPDIQYGPLPYVPRRVAGFLEYGGVSAILETGQFGGGTIDIVQPGATVASGIAGIPPMTVESITNTELVLRAEDGRSARVALSGVPGGVSVPSGAAGPGGRTGPGGPPPGLGGGRGGFRGGGRGGRGGGAAGAD